MKFSFFSILLWVVPDPGGEMQADPFRYGSETPDSDLGSALNKC